MAKLLTAEDRVEEPNKLVDALCERAQLSLVEGTGDKKGRVYVRGEFGRADKPTANKRFYPEAIWESEFKRLGPQLTEKKVLGELDHPSDGRTSLQRVSHVITNLRLKDGLVIGEAEILDTAKGRDLKAIFEAGIPVGISSRGYGSTKTDEKSGINIVQEDYRLVTFDFVAEPADSTAYPNVFFEGVEFPMGTKEQQQQDDNRLAAKFAAMHGGTGTVDMAAVREEFAKEMLAKIAEMKTSLRDQVREELMADPSVGKAKTAVEGILALLRDFNVDTSGRLAIESRDQEIAELRKQLAESETRLAGANELIERLGSAAKEAGYRFQLERLISEDADSALIRKQVGDVTRFASITALNEAIETSRTALNRKRAEESAARAEQEAKEEKLRQETATLADGLQEALQLNRDLALQLYLSKRLTNHPEAEKIRAMIEHVQFESSEQIDAYLEGFRAPAPDEDQLETVRARVRARSVSGQNPVVEEKRSRRSEIRESNYNGLGASLQELKTLSGMRSRG